MKFTLITGGARSGKSRYAQNAAIAAGGDDVAVIATARASDDEMRSRIAAHREERPALWRTIEAPRSAARAVAGLDIPIILLDCVTVLSANALTDARPANEEEAIHAIDLEIDDLLSVLDRRDGHLIAVTNEVGLSVHPPTALGRWFMDGLGSANRRLAERADECFLMVCGIPMQLK